MTSKGKFAQSNPRGIGVDPSRPRYATTIQTQVHEQRSECSINTDLPPILSEIPTDATGNWKFILNAHVSYYRRNLNNPHSVVLAHQFLLIAKNTYDGYEAGWAGAFVEAVFLHTSQDLVQNPDFWDHPPGTQRHRLHQHCSLADIDFSALVAGDHHFERHLTVSFYEYVKSEMTKIADGNRDKLPDLIAFVKNLIVEHEAFFKNAVLPSFERVKELTWLARRVAKTVVPIDATNLRKETFRKVFRELEAAQKITTAQRHSLEAAAGLGIHDPDKLKPL